MNKRIVTLAFCLQTFVTLLAQHKELPVFESKAIKVNANSFRSKFRHFTSFQLESKKLSEFVHQNAVSSFRLNLGNDKQWDIDLEPSNISNSDYRLKILTPAGTQTVSSQANFLYKGKVRGSSKEEQVRLTIKEDFIYGSVQIGGKEYFIEPLGRFTNEEEKDNYIVYETKDVISDESFSCGVQDKEAFLKKAQEQKTLKEQSPLDVICKKVKFISVADYSMYQKFGGDVYAVEAALLSNLNLAEGAFSTLNLGSDGSADVGADKLQLQMEEIVVSICRECDIPGSSEDVGLISTEFSTWIEKNVPNTEGRVFHFWTTRNLYSGNGGVAGYTDYAVGCFGLPPVCILKGTSNDPAFLRVLVAHETGHAFGCPHDNSVKATVTGFIMYSAANASRTRFSTLADFGGVNYSSQQTIRNRVLAFGSCFEDCVNTMCEDIKDLQIKSFDDSVQFTWTGTGNFIYRYKIVDSLNYDLNATKEIATNKVTLKELQPCTLYEFAVQRTCATGARSNFSSVIFNPSLLKAQSSAINIRNSLYDLKIDLDCKHCNANQYLVSIDRRKYNITTNNNLRQIIVENLFADGARHRIDIAKDSTKNSCTTTIYFTAPYYRSNSHKIFSADFNDCNAASGWKDSVLKSIASYPMPFWYRDAINFYTTKTSRGSLDSTCMIYYNSYGNAYRGALSLTSPAANLSIYKDVYFHFDFNFLSYQAPNGHDFGSFWIEAYNGTSWEKIFEYTRNEPFPRNITELKNLWDSLPQRVFLNLSKYKNKDFQIRFIVDDGLIRYNVSGPFFVAIDNIELDGYLKESATTNDVDVYPNPVKEEVFIKFNQQPASNIYYRLIDVTGRELSRGVLNNYRINVGKMNTGMYLLQLYENGKLLTTKKVLKQ
jgi:hypothetical protein